MADGYGISAFLANVMDSYDEKLLPHLRSVSWYQWLLIWLSVPYHTFKMNKKFAPYPQDQNPLLTRNSVNCGVKKGCFAKEFSV